MGPQQSDPDKKPNCRRGYKMITLKVRALLLSLSAYGTLRRRYTRTVKVTDLLERPTSCILCCKDGRRNSLDMH